MNPIETVAIDTLTPHPQNPRRGNIAAIAESIRTNGWWGVIVAQTSTRHVLAGNHRLQAARLAGLDTVPVHWLDVPDDVALRVLLADNRSGDQAGYDDDSLAELLAAIRDETGTLDGTLFTSDDLDQLLADLAPLAAVEASDDAPAVPAEAKTRPGDVFDLGPHRLVCGDSTDPHAWALLLGDERADAVFTDPPYGIAYDSGAPGGEWAGPLRNDHDTTLSADALPMIAAHLATDAPVYLCTRWDVAPDWTNALAANGLRARNLIVWVKSLQGMGDLAGAYGSKWEGIIFAHDGAFKFADGRGDDVWEVGHLFTRGHRHHPTEKPVGLVERALRDSTAHGAMVVDPFGGSGTTLVAADALGRRARLIELDPAYCDVIRQRYADHANRPDLAP